MAVSFTFQRVEKKYALSREQYEQFLKAIKPYMQLDEYGLHTICNIYFDNYTNELVRTSIEKPVYKEKLRLRSYGIPDDDSTVFLEIKKKYKGIVYKRRVAMRHDEAMAYIEYGERPEKESQILHEIDYFMQYYKPVPKLFLAYDRTAYFGKEDAEIRMTIDRSIRSRPYDLDLTHGDYGEYLTDEDMYLLEVKVPMSYPMWLSKTLSDLEIYPVSFSKYGNIYKKSLTEKENINQCLQVF